MARVGFELDYFVWAGGYNCSTPAVQYVGMIQGENGGQGKGEGTVVGKAVFLHCFRNVLIDWKNDL